MNYRTEYQKRVKFELPIYENLYPTYEINNKIGCIIFPLFIAFKGIIPNYHLNSAFWVMHSLFTNTNLKEVGIPIYFYLDNKLKNNKSIQHQLSLANIPKDRLLWFDPTPSPYVTRHYLGLKFDIFKEIYFNQYNQILIWDVDMFLGAKPNKKIDMLKLLERKEKEKLGALWALETEDQLQDLRYKEHYDLSDEEAFKFCKKFFKKFTGQEYRKIANIGGQIYSFFPEFLNKDFKEFAKITLPFVGEDENIVGLWMIRTNKKIESLNDLWYSLNIKPCFSINDMKDSQWADFLLLHIWPSGLETSQDLDYWKNLVGIKNDW